MRMQFLTGDGVSMLSVESRVDLVEEVEGRRVAHLNWEDESECNETLLSTTQLLHLLHLAAALDERDSDSDSGELVVIVCFLSSTLRGLILLREMMCATKVLEENNELKNTYI